MRRECENAKKMAKETQEKYFSESEKLRDLIRKQKGKITDHNFRPRMRPGYRDLRQSRRVCGRRQA